jgi:hypothetical protein
MVDNLLENLSSHCHAIRDKVGYGYICDLFTIDDQIPQDFFPLQGGDLKFITGMQDRKAGVGWFTIYEHQTGVAILDAAAIAAEGQGVVLVPVDCFQRLEQANLL